ncbi:MAG: PH domain-containing protein, partial [Verrucomicrobiae bacterium]|nr:PH domain-containing protein [Verrucomicrobiae bacterium]
VIWPLRREEIRCDHILGTRILDRKELIKQIGWGLRVGVGGLWGGFGWLWTKRRGLVRMYITRTDRFVWIDCASGKSWLITPEKPEEFVRALGFGPEDQNQKSKGWNAGL